MTCCKKIAAGIRELVAKVGKKKWDVTRAGRQQRAVRAALSRRSARS